MNKIYHYATECPCCGYKMDSVSGANTNSRPQPGDATVCIDCGAICKFDENMAMKLALDTSGPSWEEARRVQTLIRKQRGWSVAAK